MKITFNPYEKKESEMLIAKKNALDECKVCPVCKENRQFFIDPEKGIQGVSSGLISRHISTGLFRSKLYEVRCYKCYTCGAEFESDPYPI